MTNSLGMNFKFATDRRMTAHVLSNKPLIYSKIKNDSHNEKTNKIKINGFWKVMYSQNIKVNIGVPSTLDSLIKQQIQMEKKFHTKPLFNGWTSSGKGLSIWQ